MTSRAIPLVLALALVVPLSATVVGPAAADDAPSGSPFDFVPAEALEAPRQTRDDGAVLVEVTALDADALPGVEAAVAGLAEVVTVSVDFGVVVAWAQEDAIAALESRDDVRSVVAPAPPSTSRGPAPAVPPAGWVAAPLCRFAPVEADDPLAAAIARAQYGVDGTGVTVGILSDSFAASTAAATSPADDVALGALPGPGNPCGYETPVEVIADAPEGDDEGRAMAQLVHGIAPGARLLFATGFISAFSMADNIRALVAAGADVIVDDISWYDQPVYQAGAIADAVADARAAGVAYFSSAGNGSIADADGSQIASWATSDLTTAPCPAIPMFSGPATRCLDFGLDAPDATNRVTVKRNADGELVINAWLRWQEPWYGVTAPLAIVALTTDPVDPQVVAVGTCSTIVPGEPYVCDRPRAVASTGANPDALPDEDEFELDLVVFTEADLSALPPAAVSLTFVPVKGSLIRVEHDASGSGGGRDVTVGATLIGNNAAMGVFAVGAVDVAAQDRVEDFSSWGTASWYWEPVSSEEPGTPAAALPAPWTRDGVDAVSIDGTLTTFFGSGNRFFGTSAAAPNAAAVAALLVQAVPGISVPDLEDALRAGADPAIAAQTGVDHVRAVGAGLIKADAALAAASAVAAPLAAPVPAALVPADTAALIAAQSAGGIPELVATVSDGVATVRGLPSGLEGWTWVYRYSTPASLGWHRVTGGELSLSVAGLGDGDHHLALFRGGELAATVLVSLGARPALAASGADPGGALGLAAGLGLLGALLLAIRGSGRGLAAGRSAPASWRRRTAPAPGAPARALP